VHHLLLDRQHVLDIFARRWGIGQIRLPQDELQFRCHVFD
jgi:hypothetical protein